MLGSFRAIAVVWYVIFNIVTELAGGDDSTLDPKLVELLQLPPQSPMTGTLIAPLALLYQFFDLKITGNATAATQYLAKLFRLSSMPREFIALLMAEMLPIFDGMHPYLFANRRKTYDQYWTQRSVRNTCIGGGLHCQRKSLWERIRFTVKSDALKKPKPVWICAAKLERHDSWRILRQ